MSAGKTIHWRIKSSRGHLNVPYCRNEVIKMFGIGAPELLLILLICLLVFGADRLPEIGKALGRTISEFKKGMREVDSNTKDGENKK